VAWLFINTSDIFVSVNADVSEKLDPVPFSRNLMSAPFCLHPSAIKRKDKYLML